MKVTLVSGNRLLIELDAEEVAMAKNEAKDNDLTIEAMFEMLLGMLFIGGYSNIVGKESSNELERQG